jgi:hypothetical protein
VVATHISHPAARRRTTGTYYQYKYGCDYGDFPSTTSGPVTGFSFTDVGWRVWS